MRKTGLLLVLGVALVLTSAGAPKASAGVVVGVAVGGPVYVRPVHAYGYFGPRYVAPHYFAPGSYVAFGPAPVYPRVYIASAFSFSVQNAMASERGMQRLDKQVKHELNMLPYVNAFDYMAFTVDADNNVTLTGEVTNPVVKSDAGKVVKRIEGVESVNNQIQVLRVSPMDDRL